MIVISDKFGSPRISFVDNKINAMILTKLPEEYSEWMPSPFSPELANSKNVIRIKKSCSYTIKTGGDNFGTLYLYEGDYILPNEKDR